MLRSPALATRWFAVQAALVAAWWTWLWLVPSAREPFGFAGWPDVLLAFAPPDLLLLIGLGAAAAVARTHRHAASTACGWLTAGASLYATLWCLGANLVTGSGHLASVLMLGHALLTVWAARQPLAAEPPRRA